MTAAKIPITATKNPITSAKNIVTAAIIFDSSFLPTRRSVLHVPLGPRCPPPRALLLPKAHRENEFPEPTAYEFPEPQESEFPHTKAYEFPEPKEYELPESYVLGSTRLQVGHLEELE